MQLQYNARNAYLKHQRRHNKRHQADWYPYFKIKLLILQK